MDVYGQMFILINLEFGIYTKSNGIGYMMLLAWIFFFFFFVTVATDVTI